MKKKIFILIIMIIMVFSVKVKAECNDESLNEWVTAIQAKFVLNEELDDPYPYAYFIGLTDYRDDIKIVVYDGKGNKAEGQKFEKTINFYGVGCYTNFEEETYTVNIYGNEKSKCKNELLKTVRYTVPRLNRLRKDAL